MHRIPVSRAIWMTAPRKGETPAIGGQGAALRCHPEDGLRDHQEGLMAMAARRTLCSALSWKAAVISSNGKVWERRSSQGYLSLAATRRSRDLRSAQGS